jgi:hypothetical protein
MAINTSGTWKGALGSNLYERLSRKKQMCKKAKHREELDLKKE